MRWFVVALAMVVSQPALACHRFSIWKNPWPQRCGVAHVRAVVRAEVPDTGWYVEVITPPPLTEEEAREAAIERLKETME
jgi:hypothetical protein